MDDQIPNDEPHPDASELRFPMTVFDVARNEVIMFDGRDCRYWGPVTQGEDWNMFEGYYNWEVKDRLFLHAGNPCFWTLLTERAHVEFNIADIANIERLSADAAANWFAHNAIDLPNELDQFRTRLEFQPGPADSIVPPSQPDAVSNLVGGGTGPAPVQTAAPKSDGTRADITDEDKAIALVVKDHGLSVSDIAAKLGVKRQTPYRWEKFMAIFKGLQGLNAGNEPPRGSKDRDGNLEAEDDSE